MVGYSLILLKFTYPIIPDCNEIQKFLIRMYNLKVAMFSLYAVTNSIMMSSYKSQFEKELLLTGLFSIIFITVTTLLHISHVLIIPTRWNLILFNLVTMAFFLIVYKNAKKYKLFDGEQQ